MDHSIGPTDLYKIPVSCLLQPIGSSLAVPHGWMTVLVEAQLVHSHKGTEATDHGVLATSSTIDDGRTSVSYRGPQIAALQELPHPALPMNSVGTLSPTEEAR